MTTPQTTVKKEGDQVVLILKGYLEEQNVTEGIDIFHSLVKDDTSAKFSLLVVLDDLTGYSPEARRLWTEALRPYRDRIQELQLKGVTNPVVRMAGSAVGLTLKIPTKFLP